MVVAKIYQIRPKDKIVVVMFYNDDEELSNEFVEHFGSRGYYLSDGELNELKNLKSIEIYNAKAKGLNIPDSENNTGSILEKIVYKLNDVSWVY